MDGPEAPGSSDLAQQTDVLLVERAIDGDVDAFEVLVRRHGPMVYAYARRLAGAAVDAEDITQEALLQAWRQLPTLRDAVALRGWLLSITSHCGIDLLRRRRTTPTPKDLEPGTVDDSPAPESSAIEACLLEALSEALHRLPEQQRQCWVLREIGGHSYQEIAEILTISIHSVRGNLSRARAALLREMEAWQ
ncbi:sigma-70 family RNA polymerase sigma factor [Nesterenkonia sp. LB17]|uniref:RNA polymerase sigma factor n=1 Tax=unclassified Nesterenkonia TaxID=2629769 RepID=UPI001F4CC320|nr:MULTISPECIES: sigma-70 family RNA polymerase sigma factor [unclassified Nesterenkonia]MCH8560624.1 sigma-70 family RNA polymerase sigma factor [Nesterenkonia sp. DZ6]MCH8562902.1 sigma-70 family RNA polymerase sigma factor [Nesterenkonia sp. YGD6]MCH8565940.1 sigma-70 family RNA polymerase sigma factor [Nesterenkonia sp. LB17]MCH8570732.1 sigma-70 family RNA polymerase sigma factor [Nesterenkonia sp. AY15]